MEIIYVDKKLEHSHDSKHSQLIFSGTEGVSPIGLRIGSRKLYTVLYPFNNYSSLSPVEKKTDNG